MLGVARDLELALKLIELQTKASMDRSHPSCLVPAVILETNFIQ